MREYSKCTCGGYFCPTDVDSLKKVDASKEVRVTIEIPELEEKPKAGLLSGIKEAVYPQNHLPHGNQGGSAARQQWNVDWVFVAGSVSITKETTTMVTYKQHVESKILRAPCRGGEG
ncbi:hypothetical protein KC19_VG054700 [Ceratodon purpureus]|uniref:Uncharacterized protein n=1 Tax=Ceratodon purpureus TaxID=3225 RepID=A0A8T0HM31_CERPU|nr:hypothetical protein KC19_VG054700 [Ceratodon purpureus]